MNAKSRPAAAWSGGQRKKDLPTGTEGLLGRRNELKLGCGDGCKAVMLPKLYIYKS